MLEHHVTKKLYVSMKTSSPSHINEEQILTRSIALVPHTHAHTHANTHTVIQAKWTSTDQDRYRFSILTIDFQLNQLMIGFD